MINSQNYLDYNISREIVVICNISISANTNKLKQNL